MAKKIRVGILFGGRSAEHEVSLQSAKNIIDAIDTNKYEIVLIGIDKKGRWHLNEQGRFLLPAVESGFTGASRKRRKSRTRSREGRRAVGGAFRATEVGSSG